MNMPRKRILIIAIMTIIIGFLMLNTNIAHGLASPLGINLFRGPENPPPPPTQPINVPSIYKSPTPNSTQVALNLSTNSKRIAAVPTPYDISKITDLSPEIKDENDKYMVVVLHKDGSIEQYNIGPLAYDTNSSFHLPKFIPQDLLSKIKLQDGDKVLFTSTIMGWNMRKNIISSRSPTATTNNKTNAPYP